MKTLVPVAATVIAAALPLSAAEINGKVTLKGTPPPAAVIAAVKARFSGLKWKKIEGDVICGH
ncbi:MAG: hypothetical protein EB107_12665 [Proteobacteria bacterium]|nr:hypothetical protein [Pseudomonadota bacterium]